MPENKTNNPHGLQLVAPNTKSGGRKRKRAREVAPGLRAEIVNALRVTGGDVERVSEDYGVAKVEVLALAVAHVLKHVPPAVELRRAA